MPDFDPLEIITKALLDTATLHPAFRAVLVDPGATSNHSEPSWRDVCTHCGRAFDCKLENKARICPTCMAYAAPTEDDLAELGRHYGSQDEDERQGRLEDAYNEHLDSLAGEP